MIYGTRTAALVVQRSSSLVLIALIIFSITLLPVFATPNLTASGDHALHQEIKLLVSNMDKERAISLSQASPEFQSNAHGHDIKFHSIFTTWSASSSLSVDTLVLTGVNVVYYYNNNDGSSTNVVVTLNPGLTGVTSVVTQVNPSARVTPCGPGGVGTQKVQPNCGGGGTQSCQWGESYSTNWSGYELRATCPQQTTPVYEATSQWTVPSAGEPWQNACDNHHCDLAIWDGLTHDPGGGSGSSAYIVQAGTDSGVYCLFGGCSQFYWSWYEFYPQPLQRCPAINAGDVVSSDVINEAANGGSPSYWDIYVTDYGKGGTGSPVSLCAVVGNGFGVATPYYAQFIGERLQYPNLGYYATLPKFSTSLGTVFYMNSISINNLQVSGDTAYNTGWFNRYWMYGNGNTLNIDPMWVSGNSFSQTWLTSSGT